MTPQAIRTIMSPAIDNYYKTVTRNCWRSVADSLPHDDRFVIVHFIHTNSEGYRRVGTTESRYMCNNWLIECLDSHKYKVTHWMDWPESPQGFTQTNLDREENIK